MRPTRLLAVPAALALSVGLAGCGAGAAGQVRAKVKQFAEAAAHHDYRTICQDVLAPSLLERLVDAGVSCERATELGLAGARNPRLVIGTVTVKGRTATVLTVTQAKGEKTVLSTLELVETVNGWRIASLGAAI